MSLLTTLIIKNTHGLSGIYFVFLKKRPTSNLEGSISVFRRFLLVLTKCSFWEED